VNEFERVGLALALPGQSRGRFKHRTQLLERSMVQLIWLAMPAA
jgi:hypothetical protein